MTSDTPEQQVCQRQRPGPARDAAARLRKTAPALVVIISSMRLIWTLVAVCLAGCSSPSANEKQNKTVYAPPPMHFTATNTSNPAAKYIELVGLRVNETSPGHLQIQFGIVNHSEADIGDVKMTVNLGTTAAKPSDPPLITFPATVTKLGPSELKDVKVEIPTKLRVYELPDWQFLKADFQIVDSQ
jgi:hypothetical protein